MTALVSAMLNRSSREWQTALLLLASTAVAYFVGAFSVRASPYAALAIAFLLLAALLVTLVPNGWMVLVVLVLPFSDYIADKLRLPYVVGTPARLLLLFIFLAGVGLYLARRGSLLSHPEPASPRAHRVLLGTAVLFAVFLGWSALVRSADPVQVLAFGFDVFLLPALAFWSLSSSLPRAKRIKPVIWVATGSLAVQVALGLYEYITHRGLATVSLVEGPRVSWGLTNKIIGVRADGSFLRSDDYAVFCGAIAILLAAYWLGRSRWELALGISVLGAAGCFASGLRGVLIPFVLISAAMFLRAFGRVWKGLYVVTTAAFISSVLLFPRIDFNSYGVYRERLKDTASIYTRVASYATAVAVFRDHWFTGVGFGNYGPEATQSDNVRFYKGSVSTPYTHNSFLSFLADGGVVGGVLYISLFWAVLKRNVETGSYAASAGVPVVVLFLAVGLSLNVAYEAIPVAIAMVLAGMAHVMSARPEGGDQSPGWLAEHGGPDVPLDSDVGRNVPVGTVRLD